MNKDSFKIALDRLVNFLNCQQDIDPSEMFMAMFSYMSMILADMPEEDAEDGINYLKLESKTIREELKNDRNPKL